LKAEDWIRLGEHLKANAEILESMALMDESGMPMPDRMSKGLSWLLQKRLVDEDNDMLRLSGLLLDLGAQISLQGFERAAPDLEESLISITQLCEAYHSAKQDGALDDMERHYKRLAYAARQVATHLRNEASSTRAFLESGYGYSQRLSDRLAEISNVLNRLKRLHQKLSMFSDSGLRPLARGDRALHRLLIDSMLGAVSRNRQALDGMISRLNNLQSIVRKRNRQRQVVNAVDLFIQSGNSIDLSPLLERADAAQWLPARPLTITGVPYASESQTEAFSILEALIADLPQPKSRPAAVIDGPNREAINVPPGQEDPTAMAPPFAKVHLESMLRALIESGEAQSAADYWVRHGDDSVELGIWLYALDEYVTLQAAIKRTKGRRLNYQVVPAIKPFSPASAHRVVTDLTLQRIGTHR